MVLLVMNHQENIATWRKIVFVGFLVDVKMKLAFMMEKMEFAWVNTSLQGVKKVAPPPLHCLIQPVETIFPASLKHFDSHCVLPPHTKRPKID